MTADDQVADELLADELLAKQDFHELSAAYCRAIDRCDADLLASIWHPDATVAYGLFDGKAMDFVPFIIRHNRTLERTFHTISNEYFRISGDRAAGEIYVVGIATARVDGVLMDALVGGRYLDRYERRAGVWKIAHRTYVMDWNMNMPATAEWEEGMYGAIRTRGTRDRTDPLYEIWESL